MQQRSKKGGNFSKQMNANEFSMVSAEICFCSSVQGSPTFLNEATSKRGRL